jgi:FMN reductase
MPTRLLAIVGSVTSPGRLLSATRWLLDSASTSRKDLEVELINLADKKVAFADGRPPEQYKDDTAGIIESVRVADGVIFASPVYRGSFTGALKNLLDHLPIESLAAKPVGIVAMGATQHHFLGVDWHLRDVLTWFGAVLVPTSVYLVSADFVNGQPTDSAKEDLKDLANAVIKLKEVSPRPGSFLGPRPLAIRRP